MQASLPTMPFLRPVPLSSLEVSKARFSSQRTILAARPVLAKTTAGTVMPRCLKVVLAAPPTAGVAMVPSTVKLVARKTLGKLLSFLQLLINSAERLC